MAGRWECTHAWPEIEHAVEEAGSQQHGGGKQRGNADAEEAEHGHAARLSRDALGQVHAYHA